MRQEEKNHKVFQIIFEDKAVEQCVIRNQPKMAGV